MAQQRVPHFDTLWRMLHGRSKLCKFCGTPAGEIDTDGWRCFECSRWNERESHRPVGKPHKKAPDRHKTPIDDQSLIEKREVAWWRRHALLRAWETGTTQKSLAAHLGVTAPHVQHMIQRARYEREAGKLSPLERDLRIGLSMLALMKGGLK